MADHFVKLWASILDSSVWREPPAHRLVWITMLAIKDKHGFVGASIDGLARRANVSEEDAASAVASFLAPDPRSRNQENEGRRIKAVHRGWHILNHEYFTALQDKEALRAYEAERKAEQRRKLSQNVPDTAGHGRDTNGQERDNRPAYTSSDTCTSSSSGGESTRGVSKPPAEKPDDVTDEVWQEWLTMRRKQKASTSPLVLRKTRETAEAAGMTMDEALTHWVAQGYKGFFPPTNQSQTPTTQKKLVEMSTVHIPNMPLGTPNCHCQGCVSYRAKRIQ